MVARSAHPVMSVVAIAIAVAIANAMPLRPLSTSFRPREKFLSL